MFSGRPSADARFVRVAPATAASASARGNAARLATPEFSREARTAATPASTGEVRA
ncbi:hypothetical protein [Amycolatopsis silviterrae]|uniref:Uncharacterized protein n=1 Tax=Amycolatopsis silviterrae TaxID=1656914 RepID=A0ABW5HJQ5_9PSEU